MLALKVLPFLGNKAYSCIAGFYHSVVPHIHISKFQYISSHWEDITSDVSGSGTPKDMPCVGIWVYFTAQSIQLEEHPWDFDSTHWYDFVFFLLCS